MIPSKVLWDWDFAQYQVCCFAQAHIQMYMNDPLFDMTEFPVPPNMELTTKLRERLVLMGEFILSCRSSQKYVRTAATYVAHCCQHVSIRAQIR